MVTIRGLLVALPMLAAVPAQAQSPFDGVWKGDVTSAKLSSKPDIFAVKDGNYTCSTCIPAIATPADGQFHAVPGHPYWDEIRVTVVDPMTIRTDFRAKGQDMGGDTDTVSADGKTLTSRQHSTAAASPAGMAIDGGSVAMRIGAAVPGAHLASGSWRTVKVDAPSQDAAMIVTLSQTGRSFMLKNGTGEHYTAMFGGPAVPITGDRGGTMASVRQIDARTVMETDTRDGVVVATYRMSVLPDGRTLTLVYNDPRNGTTNTFTAYKQ